MIRTFAVLFASAVFALTATGTPIAASDDSAQSAPLDRMRHPAGTVTGRAGIAHVEKRGTGPIPLLLLPGAPFGWKAWEGFMKRNESHYTMWAITPAGYDGTNPPAMPEHDANDFTKRPWTDALIADLVALIEKEMTAPGKLGPPIVVGHHLMSDAYAVRLAHEHPDLVRGVVAAAGMGSFPIPMASAPSAEQRAKYVNENRVPFFRSVRQNTWNANTFPASSLSIDSERGEALYDAEIDVPIETQLRYYLEYATDDLAPHLRAMRAPLLTLQLKPKMSFDALAPSMKEQLVKQFGSLEEAKRNVRFGGPWDALAKEMPPALFRLDEVPDSGAFVMDDAPEVFDAALAKFITESATPAPTKKKDG